jgi:riboflavin synthase
VFSGIVKGLGRVAGQTAIGGDTRLAIEFDPSQIPVPVPGASIAVNGVCLTASRCDPASFEADVSTETLAVTTLAALTAGSRVNLEPSLRLGDPMDGHWVSGHVDGVGRVLEVAPAARSVRLRIELPEGLARYVARKGSIAVDGVSLTVNAVEGRQFDVNIVPHTRDVTVISEYRAGHTVNIEVDIVARYLERLLGAGAPALNLEFLHTHGYTSNNE